MSYKKIKRLDWDSDFFGIEVGRLNYENEKLSLINESNFDLIFIHTNKPLKNNQIPCYDKKVTFKKKILSKPKSPTNALIKKYNNELTPDLLDLAISSGIYSRFKLDPKLSSYFQKLYTQWIQNSLNGKLADSVFVYEKDNTIVGFITLKKKEDYHQIGLIATSSKYRGLGIGSSLLRTVEKVALSESSNEIRVVSQLDNTIACQFYSKNGYEINSIEYIYHKWS